MFLLDLTVSVCDRTGNGLLIWPQLATFCDFATDLNRGPKNTSIPLSDAVVGLSMTTVRIVVKIGVIFNDEMKKTKMIRTLIFPTSVASYKTNTSLELLCLLPIQISRQILTVLFPGAS